MTGSGAAAARSATARWLSRPAVLRWLGLFGAVCCAIAGLLFGAPSFIRRGVSVISILRGPHGPLIMLLWVAGLTALCAAWWYGLKLAGRGLLTARWVIGTAALWVLPMLATLPLASRDMYAYACQGALYAAGFNPYVDSAATQPCPWLESVSVVWRDTPAPYGPAFLVLAGAAAAPGSLLVALVVFRLLALLGVAAIAAGLLVLARRVDVPPDRALWLVLCCPLVPVHLVGGGHNDALNVAFLVAGLAVLAGAGRRTGALLAGGALLGLAVAVKTTTGVVLPFAALLAAGGPALLTTGGRLLPGRAALAVLAKCGATVIGGALGTLLVVSIASGLGFGWVTALSAAGESRSWTSPPTAVGIAVDAVGQWFGLRLQAVPVARTVALVLLPFALLATLWHARRHDPLHSAALACVALISLAPITQPWYLLWPLVLLAATAVGTRVLAGVVVFAMFTILPNGDGALKPLQVPLSLAVTVLTGWLAYRGVARLRGQLRQDQATVR